MKTSPDLRLDACVHSPAASLQLAVGLFSAAASDRVLLFSQKIQCHVRKQRPEGGICSIPFDEDGLTHATNAFELLVMQKK